MVCGGASGQRSLGKEYSGVARKIFHEYFYGAHFFLFDFVASIYLWPAVCGSHFRSTFAGQSGLLRASGMDQKGRGMGLPKASECPEAWGGRKIELY